MFLKVDGTAIVQLVNFAIFFAILNVLFLRPVGKAIRQRREYINSVTNDYDRYQAEAASLRMQAESLRANARREAEHLLSKARSEAADRSSEISAQFAQEVTETVEGAHATVAAEVEAARIPQGEAARELADLMLTRALPEAAK